MLIHQLTQLNAAIMEGVYLTAKTEENLKNN